MTYHRVAFDSGGTTCAAWHFPAAGGRDGRPAVVMAHGIGGTVDSGLQPFAQAFADAGFDVLAFDYRGFGSSEGSPRQVVSVARQRDDFRAAIVAAQQLPGVDPTRIVLWGVSFSGGHVISVAADRDDVAAVIALTPLVSGLATGRLAIRQREVLPALGWTVTGIKSRAAVARGGEPTLMPLVGRPGEPGALTLDGAYEGYLAMAGPTWRNEVDAGVGLELAALRTTQAAKRLRCPMLAQIADFDSYVPAQSVVKVAVCGRAEVRHYPCDHFDVWPGNEWFDAVSAHQVKFLSRHLLRETAAQSAR